LTLPAASPESQGVDPAAIRDLVEAWEGSGVRPFALRVVRHGHLVAEATWAPYLPTDRVQKYSLSKTFAASAVGLLVAEGRLSVGDTVASFFPEVEDLGPRARAMTVHHLLSMASGHTVDTAEEPGLQQGVTALLRPEPQSDPGSVFCYNQGCTLTLSAIVQHLTGEPLHAYLRPRLFAPLGIGEVTWLRLGELDQGFSGLHVTCDDVARLGLTLLSGGRFAGRQVLPEAWVRDAMTVHVANGDTPESDWEQGYGYQMWRSRHGWRGDGAFGQLCLVLPEQDMVVAACAQTEEMQHELDLVWELLLPGVHDAPLPAGPDLGDFLSGRTLPTLASTASPTAPATGAASGGRHVLRATGDAAADLAPGGTVVVDGDGLELDDGSVSVRVALGDGRWRRTELEAQGDRPGVAVAGTGGWVGPGLLAARVVPLHSPHVAEVRADLAAGAVDLTWQTVPLGTVALAGSARWG
jgi:CubicO group peptidase (beta-lactamase class C family)